MTNIWQLFKKDFYEIKNNPKNSAISFLPTLGLICLVSFSDLTQIYFSNYDFMIDVSLAVLIVFLCGEGTLMQIFRYINQGIFEKNYLNKKLKAREVLIAKNLSNLVLLLVFIVINNSISIIAIYFGRGGFIIDLTIISLFKVVIFTNIATSLGYITALLISNENNVAMYLAISLIVFGGVYKIFDLLGVVNIVMILAIFTCVSIVLNHIVIKLINSNRFIKRK